MTDGELLFLQLAAAISQQIEKTPPAPFPVDLWDIATIARVFKRSEMEVRQYMACRPDFPKAARAPSGKTGRGQALYRPSEVLAWAGKFRDKD